MLPDNFQGPGRKPGPGGKLPVRVTDGTNALLSSPTPGPLGQLLNYICEPDALQAFRSLAARVRRINMLKPNAPPVTRQPLAAKTGKRDEASVYKLPPPNPKAPRLAAEDFNKAAEELGVEAAAIRAVAEVESGGRSGFDGSGRPKILFEAHWFHKFTNGKYDKDYPTISQLTWTGGRQYYKLDQWERMKLAMGLAPEASWKSASWGMFQIMGFNHSGWKSVKTYVPAMFESEYQHLRSFLAFCQAHDLVKHLQNRAWAEFAKGYNGPGYRQNKYDTKIEAAYNKYAGK